MRWIVGLVAALLVALPVFAQPKFPAKPVTIIIPYPPGGSNDTFGRELGRRLSDAWKVPVIVENRAMICQGIINP